MDGLGRPFLDWTVIERVGITTEAEQSADWRRTTFQVGKLIRVAPKAYTTTMAHLRELIKSPVTLTLQAMPRLGKLDSGLALSAYAMQKDLNNYFEITAI